MGVRPGGPDGNLGGATANPIGGLLPELQQQLLAAQLQQQLQQLEV